MSGVAHEAVRADHRTGHLPTFLHPGSSPLKQSRLPSLCPKLLLLHWYPELLPHRPSRQLRESNMTSVYIDTYLWQSVTRLSCASVS